MIGPGVSGLLDHRLTLMARTILDCIQITEDYAGLSRIGTDRVMTKGMQGTDRPIPQRETKYQ